MVKWTMLYFEDRVKKITIPNNERKFNFKFPNFPTDEILKTERKRERRFKHVSWFRVQVETEFF